MADPLLTIDAGENLLLTFTVRDENGTAVDLTEVQEASFWLVYTKPAKVLKTWTYRDADTFSVDMQAGAGTGEIECELLKEETGRPGTLRLISQVAFTDADYFSSGQQADTVTLDDFLEISEVMEYGVSLDPADADDYDDALTDDNDNPIVG